MTSLNNGNKEAVKSVRKISLETGNPKPSSEEAKSLRRVRSESLAPASPTFTPKFLVDEKSPLPKKKKKANFDLPDATLPQAGDSSKGQTKKPPSGQKRRSSVHQGMVLDVAALHKLKKKQECDDRISICSSMQSVKTSPSPDLSPANNRSNLTHLSPSLHVSHSPDSASFKEGSNASSVYHSSCMYPPEEGPRLLGHLLEDSRKARNQYKRRMSSPTIQLLKRQQLQDSNNAEAKILPFPDQGRRHSSQDVPNLLSFELAPLPSKSKFRSTQEDLTAASTSSHPTSSQQRDPPIREDTLTAQVKSFRSSIDGQSQQRKDSNRELADQNCRSNFGIILSVLCFVLFLWYLGMASSKFIKSALSFESFSNVPATELGAVLEVTVYITAGEEAGGNTSGYQ